MREQVNVWRFHRKDFDGPSLKLANVRCNLGDAGVVAQ